MRLHLLTRLSDQHFPSLHSQPASCHLLSASILLQICLFSSFCIKAQVSHPVIAVRTIIPSNIIASDLSSCMLHNAPRTYPPSLLPCDSICSQCFLCCYIHFQQPKTPHFLRVHFSLICTQIILFYLTLIHTCSHISPLTLPQTLSPVSEVSPESLPPEPLDKQTASVSPYMFTLPPTQHLVDPLLTL